MLDTTSDVRVAELSESATDAPAVIDVSVVARKVLCFGLAVIAAALVVTVVIHHLPSLLPSRTDIVGYTIFVGFDSRQYYANYLLWVLAFPLLALGLYVVATRVTSRVERRLGSATIVIDVPSDPGPARSPGIGLLVAGVLTVSLPPPIILALHLGATVHGAWTRLIATAVLSAALVLIFGAVVTVVLRKPYVEGCHAAVAIGAALTAFAVPLAARLSHITVAPTLVVRAVRWVPWPGGLVVAAVPLVIAIAALVRSASDAWFRVTRLALVWVTGPVLVVLLISAVPGSLGRMDAFHDGEQLGGAVLLRQGAFPWRDFFAIHGLFADSFQGMLGFHLFGTSRWALVAATSAVVVPVYFVACYALNAYILRRHLLFVATWVGIVAAGSRFLDGVLAETNVRLFLYPAVVLTLAWVVRRRTWLAGVVVATLLFTQVILTPESAFLVPAVAVAVVGFDLTHRRARTWYRSLEVTTRVALPFLICSAGFAVYLIANHALQSFIYYFRIFASGHDLSGAVPVQWSGAAFAFMMIGTPALLVLAIWYLVVRVRTGNGLRDDDWPMVVVALFSLAYYWKFLARPDLHVVQPWSSIVPLLWYVVARSLDVADSAWRRTTSRLTSWRSAPSTILGCALLLLVLPDTLAQAKTTPARLQPIAVRDIQDDRLGYTLPDPEFEAVIADLRQLIPALDPNDEGVFDFTNQPGIFYFLLNERPTTRYFHVSMAIPEVAQHDLVDELEAARPAVVVYYNNRYGLPSWDGISNGVRHYDVSQYLLANYRPVVGYFGYVFLLRGDLPFSRASVAPLALHSPLFFDDLSRAVAPCDWGAASDRLAKQPAKDATRSGALALTPVVQTMHVSGEVETARVAEADSVLAVDTGGLVLAEIPIAHEGSDGPPAQGAAFQFDLGLAEGEQVRVILRDRDGTISPLSTATDPLGAATGSEMVIGTTNVRVSGPPAGLVSTMDVQAIPAGWTSARAQLPGSASDWSWLELHRRSGVVRGQYELGLPVGTAPIRFQHLTSSPNVNVDLGACLQWRDATAASVVLSTTGSLVGLELQLVG